MTGTLETTQIQTDDIRTGEVDAIVDAALKRRPSSANSTRNRSTGSSRRWSVPEFAPPANWPPWPSRKPASVCSRTRSSRTTWQPSSSTTTCATRSRSASSTRTSNTTSSTSPSPSAWCWRSPGHQPHLDGVVQGDRRRQDPQRGAVSALAVRGTLLRTLGGDPAGGRRGRRYAARGPAGDSRRRPRRHPTPVPPSQGRLHLGHRRAQDREAGQPGRKAVTERRPRQRPDLHPQDRRCPRRGRGHPDIENL